MLRDARNGCDCLLENLGAVGMEGEDTIASSGSGYNKKTQL
jgi:hypothetical protein